MGNMASQHYNGMQDHLDLVEEVVRALHEAIDTPVHVSEYDEGLKEQMSTATKQRGLKPELSSPAGLRNVAGIVVCASTCWKAERYQELTRLFFNKVGQPNSLVV
jgi:hypothetical protein